MFLEARATGFVSDTGTVEEEGPWWELETCHDGYCTEKEIPKHGGHQ